MMETHICLGISVNMLFPKTLESDVAHVDAAKRCACLSSYEALDIFLPETESLRKEVLKILFAGGKKLNYNAPPAYQSADCDAGSENAGIQRKTKDLIKRHIDYAAQCASGMFVMPSCRDMGKALRDARRARFQDFACEIAAYAAQHGIDVILEPIERGCFKDLLLGPTRECAAFVETLRSAGHKNMKLMIDTSHLPLMEESLDDALAKASGVGLAHVHLGNASLDRRSEYYGHMHAPIGVMYGAYGYRELQKTMISLRQCGYIGNRKQRATLSYEARPYTGVSVETSARVLYEMAKNAFETIL